MLSKHLLYLTTLTVTSLPVCICYHKAILHLIPAPLHRSRHCCRHTGPQRPSTQTQGEVLTNSMVILEPQPICYFARTNLKPYCLYFRNPAFKPQNLPILSSNRTFPAPGMLSVPMITWLLPSHNLLPPMTCPRASGHLL